MASMIYIYICMPSFPPSPIPNPPCPHAPISGLGTYCRRCSTCPQAPPGPRPRHGLGPWPPWELQRRPCRSLCLTMGRCPQQKGGDGDVGWGMGWDFPSQNWENMWVFSEQFGENAEMTLDFWEILRQYSVVGVETLMIFGSHTRNCC